MATKTEEGNFYALDAPQKDFKSKIEEKGFEWKKGMKCREFMGLKLKDEFDNCNIHDEVNMSGHDAKKPKSPMQDVAKEVMFSGDMTRHIEDFKNSPVWEKGEINSSNYMDFVFKFCNQSGNKYNVNDVLKEPPVWEGLLKIVVIVGGLLVLAYMIIVNVRPGGGA